MRKSQPDTFSFAFVSTATPLHPHIKVAATILLLQLLGADNFSGNNTRSAIFEVLGKWFNVPTEREFLQTPGTDVSEQSDARLVPLEGGAEGHWCTHPV